MDFNHSILLSSFIFEAGISENASSILISLFQSNEVGWAVSIALFFGLEINWKFWLLKDSRFSFTASAWFLPRLDNPGSGSSPQLDAASP